jgi:putative cell wall-binding protein
MALTRRRTGGALGTALLATLLSVTALLSPAASQSTRGATSIDVDRFGGPDRYAVAANASAATFAPAVAAAVVATGQKFPDALAAGPLAALLGGPVLLTYTNSIPDVTLAELTRLRPQRIIIAGGPGSVSDEVAEELAGYQTGGGVSRVGGADRYAVAGNVSKSFAAPSNAVYIASGAAFADALAGSAAAGRVGSPLLLTTYGELPDVTISALKRLKPAKIFILGGPATVSADVAGRLADFAPVTRLGGANRYAVAVNTSKSGFGSTNEVAYLAVGTKFPDALAGGPLASGLLAEGPMLLLPPTGVPLVVADELRRLSPTRLIVLGGPASVPKASVDEIRSLLGEAVRQPFEQMVWQGTRVSQQKTSYWCVPASVQQALNILNNTNLDSKDGQQAIYDYGLKHQAYPMIKGLDPQAWAASLGKFSDGRLSYVDKAYPTYGEALRDAVVRMRSTGNPVGLLVLSGMHAWNLVGYKTDADPALFDDFKITGIYVIAPYIAWGDPQPGTYFTYEQFKAKFTPYDDEAAYEAPGVKTRWRGLYTLVVPETS